MRVDVRVRGCEDQMLLPGPDMEQEDIAAEPHIVVNPRKTRLL
jgi:hypothetical protein